MWFALNKDKNTIKIKKMTSDLEDLEVVLKKIGTCGSDVIIESKTQSGINAEITIELPYPNNSQVSNPCENTVNIQNSLQDTFDKSGLYELYIKVGNHEETLQIPNYPRLLKDIIKDIEKLLCKCNCQDCDDCYEDGKTLLDVLFKAMFYYSLSGEYYQSSYSKGLKCLACDLNDYSICMIMSRVVTGNTTNIKLVKELIALFYLVFYYTENKYNCNKEFVNEIFNFNNMMNCINKIGINIECVRKALENRPPRTGLSVLLAPNRTQKIVDKSYFLDTDKIYRDPENDFIYKIKITKIVLDESDNLSDKLQLDGVDVVVGQEIDFSDIENNKLVFIPRDTNRASNSYFEWETSDNCGMRYTP